MSGRSVFYFLFLCPQKEKKEETFGLVIPGKSLVSETSLSHFMHVFLLIVVSAMQSFVLYVLFSVAGLCSSRKFRERIPGVSVSL